ncbi:extracellular solute-binding protein [Streptosporangiaceae bacterium NEAU-GS5]|nr:extracellular solute-binding protein [Streptosporangiaceae bacterium NEAU-GS5]
MRFRWAVLLVALTAACGTALPDAGVPAAGVATPIPSLAATSALTPTPSPTPSSSSTPSPSATPSQSPGRAGEGAVTVLALPGYAEWGGNDKRVNWVVPFENKSGCKVTVRELATDPVADPVADPAADPAARLDDVLGPYDVVSAPPDLAGLIVAAKGAAVVDTARIPTYDAIPKRLRPRFPDGETYAVPFLWSTDTVLYEGAKGDIYHSDGPVLYRNSPLTIGAAALTLEGVRDPFQLTPEQFADAVALVGRDGQHREFWRDPIEVVQGFATGSARFAQAPPYVMDLLNRAGRKVKAVAQRPVTGRVDSWVMAADAPHPRCAYAWMAYASTAEVQRQVAAWTGLAPANPGACAKEAARRVCDDYGVNDLKGISFASLPAKDCGPGSGGKPESGKPEDCVDYAEWVGAWRQITG